MGMSLSGAIRRVIKVPCSTAEIAGAWTVKTRHFYVDGDVSELKTETG